MVKKQLCSEYEAACITGMSPELLRWLTSHAPKSGVDRKLKTEIRDETYFFEVEELKEFDAWLKMAWPKKDGKRPNVPSAIRREIINEANGECAICHGHKDTCEAAHLDPVHKSNNNHPENLLWLCANHHTTYDDGLFGPNDENAEFVLAFKRVLHRYKVMLWRTQHKISDKLLTVLEDCDGLAVQLKKAKTKDQVEAVEKIARNTLSKLPNLAPVSKNDPKYKAFQSISANVESLSKDKSTVSNRLAKAQNIRREYVAAYGFVACPLCKGSGRHDGSDCPVCNGDREIEESFVDRIDLQDYQKVKCPLCEGEGRYDGDDCPECGGDGRMDRRYADRVDLGEYKKVDCPLCEGEGRYDGDDCPECGGDGTMDRRYADRVDLGEYKKVDCPLCEGEGRHGGDDCPECGGEGKMDRRHADRMDLGDYKKVKCPLCKGSGRRNGDDCPECGGEGKMDRRYADQVDLHRYADVECPVCRGRRTRKGDDCRACDGQGQMERRFADNIDPREFD